MKYSGRVCSVLQVELQQEIGRGSFGVTHKGEYRGATVAVKCAHIQKDQHTVNFLREVKALTAVRHPNVMGLKGGFLSCSPCKLCPQSRSENQDS